MKHFFILFASLLFICSCHKQETIIDTGREWGTLEATRNDVAWGASCQTWLIPNNPGKFNLSFRDSGYRTNDIDFANLPFKTGVYYPIQKLFGGIQPDSLMTISYTNTLGGDVGGDSYRIIQDNAALITIETVDQASGVVTGAFSGTFVKSLLYGFELDTVAPDTVIYKNGHFKAHVLD